MYCPKKRCIVGRHDGEPISERYIKIVEFRRGQLTRNPTKAEQHFEKHVASLIADETRTFYRSQKVFYIIDGFAFIADFYFPKFRTVVEIDGASHRKTENIERDKWRDEVLFRTGKISVVRFTNKEVLSDIYGTFNRCVRFLSEREHATPSYRKILRRVYEHLIY